MTKRTIERTSSSPPDRVVEAFYTCTACEVYGRGDRCWSCGSVEVVVRRPPAPAALPAPRPER